MFAEYELPSPAAKARLIFAMNKARIFERLDSGLTMTPAFRELDALVRQSEDAYPKLDYSTFRRFIKREKLRDTVQIGKADSAGKIFSPEASSRPRRMPPGYPARDVTQPAQDGGYPPALDPKDF